MHVISVVDWCIWKVFQHWEDRLDFQAYSAPILGIENSVVRFFWDHVKACMELWSKEDYIFLVVSYRDIIYAMGDRIFKAQ